MTKSFALALGGGGARGLAHIAVLEALDDMGQKPAAIAGTSIGALIAAAYAAGMSGREIRRFVITLAHDRAEVFRRLIATRAGTFANLFNLGFGSATLVDAEKFCQQFLPDKVPEDFGELEIPLTIIATDLYRRQQAAFSCGPLKPALAASIALPTVMRPVVVAGRDLPVLGIPSRTDVVEAYRARTGLDARPHLAVYLAYNFFRLAAILQGIAGRLRDGTAASENAAGMATLVRPLAAKAWEFAREAGAR